MPDYQPDALDWTPQMALQSAVNLLSQNKVFTKETLDPNKCMIIFLADEDDGYSTRYIQAGFTVSEMVALLEIIKSRLLQHINQPSR
jgi:hypothetical protein